MSCASTSLCVAVDIGGNAEVGKAKVIPPAATVSHVSPASGTLAGGMAVTVTGTGFESGAVVEIGQGQGPGSTAIQATDVKVVSPTEITATTASATKAGTFNLFVVQRGEHSPGNPGDYYTYRRATVSHVSPASGTVAGGTAVAITGTGFVSGVVVEIGQGQGPGSTAIQATDVKVVSPTEITATTASAPKAGTFNLFVLQRGEHSTANPGDGYTYTVGG